MKTNKNAFLDVTHITARSNDVASTILNPIIDAFFSATKNGNYNFLFALIFGITFILI